MAAAMSRADGAVVAGTQCAVEQPVFAAGENQCVAALAGAVDELVQVSVVLAGAPAVCRPA